TLCPAGGHTTVADEALPTRQHQRSHPIMIDSLFRAHIDPIWERAARPLIRLGMTPNQVTAAGLVLVLLVSAIYLLHRSSLLFGLTLAFAFTFDALDGAVARQRDMRTKVGGYFDAVVDRYQELA